MNLPGTPLTENDLAMLAAAWIEPEHAGLAQLRRVSSIDGAQLVGRKDGDNCAGIVFPYVWPGESSAREVRLRRDVPDVKIEGGKRRETGKYLAAPGRGNILYFFPATPAAWLKDVELPIVITEGEKKTIALWRLAWHDLSDSSEHARFLPIGLSGVWNWRGTIGKEAGPNGERVNVKGAISDFGRIEWKERKVIILFDSNVKTNQSVAAARTELARYLIHECGAHVHYADMPKRDGINGVDDLLAASGPAKVLPLIERAKEAKVKESKTPAAAMLGRLFEGAEFFHSADGKNFVSFEIGGHTETWPLKSKGFIRWLHRRFWVDEQKIPTTQAIEEASRMCEGLAQWEGPEREVGVRVLRTGSNLYLDLCDENWRAVEVSPTGWRVTQDAPVRFRRQEGMTSLPHPISGRSLDDLRAFLNADDEENWILMVAWLIGSLHPTGPYPLLVLQGEQGSRKSTAARFLRSIIDPSAVPIRSEPREERDLMISANNSWIISMDNLSGTKAWLSDALCRLSTGGGFSVRQLHSDDQETLFQAKRPIILNGIDEMTSAPDLADRSLILWLPKVNGAYIGEDQLTPMFNESVPGILGALLDAVAIGLRRYDQIEVPNLPRMADFTRWVMACSPGLPFTGDQFLHAYESNRMESVSSSIDSSPIARAIVRLVLEAGSWKGTSSELLYELDRFSPAGRRALPSWPKEERHLGNAVRRVAPVLRQTGININFVRHGKFRTRLISIESPKCPDLVVRLVRQEATV